MKYTRLFSACLAVFSSLAAAAPQQGRDYYSIQFLSGSASSKLQAAAAKLSGKLPYVRVEDRQGVFVLRAGFWENETEAQAALAAVRGEFVSAKVRVAVYRPDAERFASGAASALPLSEKTAAKPAASAAKSQQAALLAAQRQEQSFFVLPSLPPVAGSAPVAHAGSAPVVFSNVERPARPEPASRASRRQDAASPAQIASVARTQTTASRGSAATGRPLRRARPEPEIASAFPFSVPEIESEALLAVVQSEEVVPQRPDERVFWTLLRNGDFTGFDNKLTLYQVKNPKWQPSKNLLRERDKQGTQAAIKAALQAQDRNALAQLDASHPEEFDCRNAGRVWALAELAVRDLEHKAAKAYYQRLIPLCVAPVRIGTLYKAMTTLPSEMADELIEQERKQGKRNAKEETLLVNLVYDRDMARLLTAYRNKQFADAEQRADALAERVKQRKNAAHAALLGWVKHEVKQYPAALAWFERAQLLAPEKNDARYGLALTHYDAGEFDKAEPNIQIMRRNKDNRANALQADIVFARAVAANKRKDWSGSNALIAEAGQLGRTGRDMALLRAWNQLNAKQESDAAKAFEKLYREQADAESAEGLVLALQRSEGQERIPMLVAELGQPYASKAAAWEAQRYHQLKLYQAGARLEAQNGLAQSKEKQGVAASSGLLGASVRSKSGESGMSQLIEARMPLLGAEWISPGGNSFQATVAMVTLDAGALAEGAKFGGQTSLASTAAENAKTSISAGESYLSWEHQDWTTVGAGFGMRATHPDLPQGFSWHLDWKQQAQDGGEFKLRLRQVAETSSMLSYTGMADPVSGRVWGNVSRTGVIAQVMKTDEQGEWMFSGKAQFDRLSGVGVEDNQAIEFSAGLAREMGIDGFDFFALGPSARFASYKNNQNHFTYGHGGYFSPQAEIATGLALQLQSKDGQRQMMKAYFEAGMRYSRQEAAPIFTSAPSLGRYPGSSDVGTYLNLNVAGAWQFDSRWQLGSLVSIGSSKDSREWKGMVTVRYFFAPRSRVWSSDLPQSTEQGNLRGPYQLR